MAKAKKFTVEGTINWARVFEDNRDMDGYNGAYQPCDGAYTFDLLVDEDNMKKLQEAGTAKKFKEVETGKYKVKMVRKHVGPFDAASGPPKVVWNDGSSYDYDVEGSIGNGSFCEVRGVVYPTKAGINGTRFDTVVVKDHVVYTPEDDDEVPV